MTHSSGDLGPHPGGGLAPPGQSDLVGMKEEPQNLRRKEIIQLVVLKKTEDQLL